MSNPTSKVSQDSINAAAWKACDTFRGAIDPTQYKDYILVMLFLKYISDTSKAHLDDLIKRYGDDKVRLARALERERFQLPQGASFSELHTARNESDIGERINKALEAIEEKNRSKLEGVFRNIDFNSETLGKPSERNRRLKALLEDFNKPELDLSPGRVNEDVIGECYIYLISQFASDAGKKAVEFYTPAVMSRLLAKLAGPQKGHTIFDPTCGSGSLLLEASKVIKEQNAGSTDFALFGQEVNGATWALARMNMFLHGQDSSVIKWCNTLTGPELLDSKGGLMQFDRVVANPPFSLDKWGFEEAESDKFGRYTRGTPPESRGDYAFISHIAATLKPGSGKAAIIVPHGVLFRGAVEGRIRQKLLEENLIDAVIGLPAGMFSSTGIPVAILVIDRSREQGGANAKRKDVLFIDASRDYLENKKQVTLSDAQEKRITDVYVSREAIEKYSHAATFNEIKENEFNLNIPRYVDTFEAEAVVDIAKVQKEILDLEKKQAELRVKMNQYLKELGLN
jgi:type I restriction enzyme M protein